MDQLSLLHNKNSRNQSFCRVPFVAQAHERPKKWGVLYSPKVPAYSVIVI